VCSIKQNPTDLTAYNTRRRTCLSRTCRKNIFYFSCFSSSCRFVAVCAGKMNWQRSYRGLLRLVPRMPADNTEGSIRLQAIIRSCYRRGITIEDGPSIQTDGGHVEAHAKSNKAAGCSMQDRDCSKLTCSFYACLEFLHKYKFIGDDWNVCVEVKGGDPGLGQHVLELLVVSHKNCRNVILRYDCSDHLFAR
jgi:hypothetical protein